MMQSRSIDQLAMQVEESKCQDNIYHMKSMIKGCQTIMQVRKALDHIKCSIITARRIKVSSMQNTRESQNISCKTYKM